MVRTGVWALVALGIVQMANGDVLNIIGEEVPGTEPSSWFTLQIENPGTTDVPIIGWTLECMIVGEPGSAGQVSFGSIEAPPNYVFGVFGEYYGATGLGTEDLIAYDMYLDVNPPVVPALSVMGLLKIELQPTNAVGTFDIVMYPQPLDQPLNENLMWNPPDLSEKQFVVVPLPNRSLDGPGLVVASVVFGATPEPPVAILSLSGAITLVIGRYWRKKNDRRKMRGLATYTAVAPAANATAPP